MSEQTVDEAIRAHFKRFETPETIGFFVDNSTKDRLLGHDFLHTVLDTKIYTTRAEEIVAIYQAVLLGDPEVDRSKKEWRDEGHNVTPKDIHNTVMPGIRRFIAQVTGQAEHTIRPAMSEPEIAAHYEKAVLMRERFHGEFGCNLGDMQASDLRAMPFAPFRSLVMGLETPQSPQHVINGGLEINAQTAAATQVL